MTGQTLRLILCGNVEKSTHSDENVGVVSVVYVSFDEKKTQEQLEQFQKCNPEKFYMAYEVPMDTDLSRLSHYPSLEIGREDLGI
ncbi:MAG: hypothetical protein K6G30_03870 [Acetatifactor sp.]|nr:hypothetical protein [Acetatifactor sp.]